MNTLNLNRLSFKATVPSYSLPCNIGWVLFFVSFIFIVSAHSEEVDDSGKPPVTGPLTAGMKKLSSSKGIITDFPIVPPNIIKQAGFITQTPESVGSIIDSVSKLERFGRGEIVYINTGSEKGVSTGDRLAIVRHNRTIYHPVRDLSNKKPLGNLIEILGDLEILQVDKDTSQAIIRESYEDMMIGDRLMPSITPPILLDSRDPVDKTIEGYIVASKVASSSLSKTNIVYLDVGQAQNVELGDRFEVYVFPNTSEEILPNTIGELLVINCQEETSAAVVMSGTDELKVGRKIRYKKQ